MEVFIMNKRILLLLLILFIIVNSVFAGAQGESTESTVTSGVLDADLVNPKGTFPIAKELTTLTVFSGNTAGVLADNKMVAWMAEELNLDIKFTVQSQDGLADKLMIKLVSDNLDDLTRLAGAGAPGEISNAFSYVNDGYFYPISDLFEEYGDVIPGWEADEPDVFNTIRADDGKIYTIPARPFNYDSGYWSRLMIEQTWLDNLGLEMPTTIDEYFDVLVAFRDQDANNNGDPNDEIPFSACTRQTMTFDASPLWGPFLDHFDWLQVQDGKVSLAATKSEFQDALRFMNSLWEADLVYSESFSQDRGTQWQVNEANDDYNVIGSTVGQHVNFLMSWGNPKWKTYNYIPPLEGPGGINVMFANKAFSTGFDTVISVKSEYPATAFRFLDWISGEEGHLKRYNGLEGIHYRAAEPGELAKNGKQAVWTTLDAPEEYDNWGLGHIFAMYGGKREFFDTLFSVNKNPDALNFEGKTWGEMLYKTTSEYYPYNDALEEVWPSNIVFPSEVRTEMGILKTNINDLITESNAKFVIGELDLDSDWDQFQSELKNAGLERYLQLCQEALDAKNN